MKNTLLFLMLLLSGMAGAQIVNIPDANFKARLVSASLSSSIAKDNNGDNMIIDTNNDGEIQLTEAQAVWQLNIQSNGNINPIVSMEGLSAFTNLRIFNCNGNQQLTSLDCSGLTHVRTLNCDYNYNLTELNIQGLMYLKAFSCNDCYHLPGINAEGLTSLITLSCNGCSDLTALNVQGLTSLETLNCKECISLTELSTQGLTGLKVLSCNNSSVLSDLNVLGSSSLEILNCVDCDGLINLNLQGLTSLEILNCRSSNNLAHINVEGLNNLTELDCNSCNLEEFDLQELTGLQSLDLMDCNFSTLNLSVLQNLAYLSIGNNGLSDLDLAPGLGTLHIKTYGTESLDLTELEHLQALYINEYDMSGSPLSLQTLILGNKTHLTNFYIDRAQLESLDLSGCTALAKFEFFQSAAVPLLFVNLKNGVTSYQSGSDFDFSNTTTAYVCVDEGEETAFLNIVGNNSGEVIAGNYCTFTPGGAFNTITGHFTFDSGNDGCDSGDNSASFAKVIINDGLDSGTSFSSTEGNYNFYTQSGTFTLIPETENDWFTITPPTAVLTLPTVNDSTTTQNFCIAPNGVHPDVEVVITPMNSAAPGFDTYYKIVYKNKGNQLLSGAVTLNYDDSILDYIMANPVQSTLVTGSLTWNYTNLMPFESRSMMVVLNLNGPMEIPAVNIDDVLTFSASVTPTTGDETPADNTFILHQTVVGSFDPNDITCLEGSSVSPDKIGEYLHYNINFENTGTAPATFIVVKDIIDETKFDISSLQLMDASHAIETRINGNKVEFIFDNINLGPEEKGNVTFKIKTLNTLQVNDDVTQQADIFFDYNWPIQTNEATTTFEVLSRGDFTIDNSVKVYPNPAKHIITISADSNINSIQFYDIQGRLLQSGTVNGIDTFIDLSSRTSGMYFVKVFTDKGIKVEKIAKE